MTASPCCESRATLADMAAAVAAGSITREARGALEQAGAALLADDGAAVADALARIAPLVPTVPTAPHLPLTPARMRPRLRLIRGGRD
jgi:hypothetical protein